MNRTIGKVIFAIVYVIGFVAAIDVINAWQWDIVMLASVPVILSAEALVLGMLYATIFHGELEEVHGAAGIEQQRVMRTVPIKHASTKTRAA